MMGIKQLQHCYGLVLLWAVLAISMIKPPYPELLYLQHIPTVAALLCWPYIQRRLAFSFAASAGLAVFMLLHILGTRYIYSYVPYDEWMQALAGVTLTGRFALRRNHYDRVVHFAFGLLFARLAFEIFRYRLKLSDRLSRYLAADFILAASALYELFEWLLTLVLAGSDADAYNGQQGDAWDAHKDMALAFIGSICALCCIRRQPSTEC